MTKLLANWPAPPSIQALTTTRLLGHSKPPYDSNNLGLHVGDREEDVYANRKALIQRLSLLKEPLWLEQTHSNRCVLVEEDFNRQADAAVTRQRDNPLVIMTADCLPILLCDRLGNEIAAIHAGWRGLAQGIIENTLAKMKSPRENLLAWIGPGICHRCYETGHELKETFINRYPFTTTAFYEQDSRLYANLPELAERILKTQAVNAVYQSKACTYELDHQFYSYRRSSQTGRMATLIWFNDEEAP